MSLKELEADNHKLRETLKNMNDQLSKVVDRARVSSLAPRKTEFKNKSYEEKLRTTLKEIENNEKILEFTINEYTTMKARIDQIKDPNYELDVEEKTRQTRAKIEEVRKANKSLNLATGNIAKDLHVIDQADGVAPLIQEANEKARELAIMKRKLKRFEDLNEAFELEREQKNSKLEKAQEDYNKLLSQAGRYKVTNEDNKLSEKYHELKGKVKTYENHVKHTTNTNEKYMKNQLEKAIEELYVVNMRDTETLERLETMINEQRQVLNEMIEKEEHKIDKNTKEVINKIKISMDGNKMTLDPAKAISAESSRPQQKRLSSKPPAAVGKSNYDLYTDLPLYNPPNANSNVKVDSLLNKKDIAKKEIMAIREKTRRDEEDKNQNRSLTPKHDQKPKGLVKDNTKPNLKAKDVKTISNPDLGGTKNNSSPQQAEQEKPLREKTPEVKKKEEEVDSSGLKPVFSKPNLFKKNPKTENTAPETKPVEKETYKEPELKLYGSDNKGKKESLALDNAGPSFFVTDPSSKKGELILPGSLGNQNKPAEPKKNEELSIGGPSNYSSQKKPLAFEDDDFKPKQESVTNVKNNADEEISLGALGGLSRLNKLKKGGGNNAAPAAYNLDSKDTHTLELPGGKPSGGLTLGEPQQLTLSNNNTTKNNDLQLGPSKTNNEKLFNYGGNNNAKVKDIDDDDFFGGGTTGNKGLNLGGFGKPTNNNDNLFGKKEEPVAKGRDRTHLLGGNNEKNNDDDLFGNNIGNKKEPVVQNNNKGDFDPDDVFNDKPAVKKENKVDSFGMGGSSNNQSSGTGMLGPTGIPGVRSGRAGVPGRPKQVTDDDLFGGSPNKNMPTTDNSGAVGLGFGKGAAAGGFGSNNKDNDDFGFGKEAAVGGFGLNKNKNDDDDDLGFGKGGAIGGFGGGFANKNKKNDDDDLGFGKGNAVVGFGAGLANKNKNDDDDFGINLPAGKEVTQPKRMRMGDPKQKDEAFKNKVK